LGGEIFSITDESEGGLGVFGLGKEIGPGYLTDKRGESRGKRKSALGEALWKKPDPPLSRGRGGLCAGKLRGGGFLLKGSSSTAGKKLRKEGGKGTRHRRDSGLCQEVKIRKLVAKKELFKLIFYFKEREKRHFEAGGGSDHDLPEGKSQSAARTPKSRMISVPSWGEWERGKWQVKGEKFLLGLKLLRWGYLLTRKTQPNPNIKGRGGGCRATRKVCSRIFPRRNLTDTSFRLEIHRKLW